MKNVICVLIVLCPYLLYSQSTNELDETMEIKVRTLEGTLSVGLGAYEGDLLSFDDADLGLLSDLGFSFAIGIKKHFSDHFTIGLTYTNLSIDADEINFAEADHKARGYKFENNLHEISILAEYYPFSNKEWKIQPYAYGGPGVVFGSPETDFGNFIDAPNNESINTDLSEVKESSFALPIGLGARIELNERLSLSAQASLRFLANDYLDGASVAANPDIGDYFGDGVLKIGYKF